MEPWEYAARQHLHQLEGACPDKTQWSDSNLWLHNALTIIGRVRFGIEHNFMTPEEWAENTKPTACIAPPWGEK